MKLTGILLFGLVAIGCATEENRAYTATTPGSTTLATSQSLDYALLAAARGERGPWSVDGLYAERGDDGALIVARDSGWRALRQPVAGLDAGIVTANITARLASDPVTREARIRIDCDDTGLCSLSGHLPTVFAAHRAIEDTLAVPGVMAVESHLRF